MAKKTREEAKIRLPVLRGGQAPALGDAFVDTVILPRDQAHKDRLEVLEEKGAQELDLPPGANKSWMSIQRHVVTVPMDKPSAISVREQLEEAFTQREITVYLDRGIDAPVRIALEPPISSGDLYEMFVRAGSGHVKKPKKPSRPAVSTIGLLTETSKMGCYSFNLPAGPKSFQGTCPASSLGFMYSTVGDLLKAQRGKRDPNVEIDPERFICNGCYAIKGAYGNPSTISGMQLKYHVVRALLGKSHRIRVISAVDFETIKESAKRTIDKPNDTQIIAHGKKKFPRLVQPLKMGFSDLMVVAISEARVKVQERRERLEHFGYTAAEYQRGEHVLNWLTVRKEVRTLLARIKKSKTKGQEERFSRELDAMLAGNDITLDEALSTKAKYKKTFADWQLPDGNFFRIHDAGDMYSDPYFRAWLDVCRHFSSGKDTVNFWAPTRMWAFAGGLKDESLKSIPPNLAMRPSTLHFRDEAPSQAYLDSLLLPRFKNGGGLSAPSGSAPELPSDNDYKCPAYEHWTKGGGALRLDPKTKKGVGGTCITARGPNQEKGCRACWMYNDLVVFYEEH